MNMARHGRLKALHAVRQQFRELQNLPAPKNPTDLLPVEEVACSSQTDAENQPLHQEIMLETAAETEPVLDEYIQVAQTSTQLASQEKDILAENPKSCNCASQLSQLNKDNEIVRLEVLHLREIVCNCESQLSQLNKDNENLRLEIIHLRDIESSTTLDEEAFKGELSGYFSLFFIAKTIRLLN